MFMGAYRKLYGIQHVLIWLLEGWRMQHDQNKIVGKALRDLSWAFKSAPHDLLIPELCAYGVRQGRTH